jgi:carotenoid cleavage dioxygenase
MTAHPKVDPVTGELIFFGYDVFGPPFLRSHVVDSGGILVRTEEIDVPRAVMMHDFGVTATRMVFLDLPVVFDLDLAVPGQSLPFRWMPEAGARVGLLTRDGRGSDIQWIGTDPCYVFHVLNAFDVGGSVVMDVVRYDSAFDTLPGESIATSPPVLARWTVDPSTRRIAETILDDVPIEFPRIDEAVAGRPHRFGYCLQLTGTDMPAGLIKYDLARDESERFDPGQYRQAGEPVFVRAADGSDEGEGWVLSVVYDAARDTSDLVILDATSFGGPPVAIVHLPARVPFGFHGSWIPANA